MPIYEYGCIKCGSVKDLLTSFAEADVERKCEKCLDGELVRTEQIHAAGLNFKGRWFKTTKGY